MDDNRKTLARLIIKRAEDRVSAKVSWAQAIKQAAHDLGIFDEDTISFATNYYIF